MKYTYIKGEDDYTERNTSTKSYFTDKCVNIKGKLIASFKTKKL